MSFAYIEGQEAQALVYFEKQLEQCADVNQRKELEIFVQKLRDKIKETTPKPQPHPTKESFSINSALVLSAVR